MIIVEIIGGLGNQLFEYAHARNLSKKLNLSLKLDLTFFETYKNPDVYRLDKYNVIHDVATPGEIDKLKRVQIKNFASKVFLKVTGNGIYKNNSYHVDEKTYQSDKKKLQNPTSIYLSGYWQSEKYFKKSEKLIRDEFSLTIPINEGNEHFLKKINASNSVAVHVRRGDYVNNSFFVNVPMDYYKKAIEIIKSKVKYPVFFFFSDDLHWVKQNIKLTDPHYYVDINNGKTDYFDLKLMSACKHNIIANSSFSWWGAWLNSNTNKVVIAPGSWYCNTLEQHFAKERQLLPPTWIKI